MSTMTKPTYTAYWNKDEHLGPGWCYTDWEGIEFGPFPEKDECTKWALARKVRDKK